jgi:hypothetical protein
MHRWLPHLLPALAVSLSLACGGMGKKSASTTESGAAAEAPAQAPAQQTSRHGGSFSFGKPADWTREKETLEDGGKKYVIYTLAGEEAQVQLVIHPPGTAPSPAEEMEGFLQVFRAELGDVAEIGEPTPISREMAGQTAQGLSVRATLPTDAGPQMVEHRSYTLTGADSQVQVIIDIPNREDPAVEPVLNEVLDPLQIP